MAKTGINAPVEVDEVAEDFFKMAKKIAAKYFKDGKKHTIVGNRISRGNMAKGVWAYIKENDLQNPDNKREIFLDETLQELFDTNKKKISMFKMTGLYNNFIVNQ